MTAENFIDLSISDNDSGANTIRGYLKALLKTLWKEGESFSGKSPFGNSGWEWDLYRALVEVKAVYGEIDPEWGDLTISEAEIKKANKLIFDCIELL